MAWRPIRKQQRVSQKKAPMATTHADEAQVLRRSRRAKVGVRLGQVVQLLDAGPEALAEPLAAAEGDQAVRQLVGLAGGVLLVPGVEVGKDALSGGIR